MSQLGKSPFTSSFDPATYLDDFLNALDNVPAEVTFILSEIREKDSRLRDTQASIQAKQQTLRKYARSDTAAPAQEERVRESINEKFNIAEQLAEEKMMLSRKLLDLLDRHLKKLDADMTRAREDWTDVIQQSADTSHAFLTDTTIAHLGEFDTGLSHLLHVPPPSSSASASRKQRKSVPPTPSTLPLDTPSRPPTSVASLPVVLPSSSSSSSLSAAAAGSSTAVAATNAAVAAANARRKRSRATADGSSSTAVASASSGAPTAIGHAIHAALGPAIHPAVAAAAARQSLPNSPASFSSPTTPAGTPLPSMKSPNVGNNSGAPGAAGSVTSGAMRHRHPKAATSARATSGGALRMDDDDIDDLDMDSIDEEDAMAVDGASAGDDLDDLDDVMSVDSDDGRGALAAGLVQHPGALVHGSRTSGGSAGAVTMRGGLAISGAPSVAATAAGSGRRSNTRNNAGAAVQVIPKISVLPHHHILHQQQQQQQTASMSSQDDAGDDDRLYCTCQRTSFGDMIGCDNASCRYEWFHLECLKQPPTESQEKWYCDECCRIMGLTNNNPALSATGAGGGRKDRKRKA
ncbi:inhibitor of growth proteins N-terminal histone-binding-domain-containing protein [Catenaria anguillulae PL171]|uniref:Chromatin modification-related protein n=1 Tax=Catenaria anguillulae PL171 TaxID=765915 RepID=A0A1Y2HDZ9_9FUNG|nr:inhibitor of growth proteins N-terminal histone-binding-domain-containing protein [Catenaria anguillulae PL171]